MTICAELKSENNSLCEKKNNVQFVNTDLVSENESQITNLEDQIKEKDIELRKQARIIRELRSTEEGNESTIHKLELDIKGKEFTIKTLNNK